MITRLSNGITLRLIELGTIEKSDQELYSYGVFMLTSQILYFTLSLLTGLIFNVFAESIVFFITFQSIRKIAGGYHASTEGRCTMMSILSIVVSIGLIGLLEKCDIDLVVSISSTISAILIFVLAPLDTDEKSLSTKEYRRFKKKTRVILLIIVIIIVLSLCIRFDMLFLPCCVSLILEGILLLAGKIKKVKMVKHADH